MESTQFWIVVGFHLFILAVLALDLGVFQKKAHVVTMREAAIWTSVWVTLAMLFAFCVWKFWYLWDPSNPKAGGEKASYFLTGYLIELCLSVDNLFVFLVIFRYFGVPRHLQHRVLFWGIVGAVIMRAAFILLGVALLHYFHWMIYVFGGLLIYTGWKLLGSVEHEIDPGKNPLLRIARRLFPIIDNYDQPKFWVKRDGKWHATPLILVLLVVESTDVVFAVDSIPAIFGLWDDPADADPFIVFTSNIFAVLGLRSLFFLLSHFLGMFRYLNVGLALVLAVIGLKMLSADLLAHYGLKIPIWASLGGIATILGISIIASLLAGPKPLLDHPPEDVKYGPKPPEPEPDKG